MKTIRSIAELRTVVREARSDCAVVGVVPTMGALHAGHLSLIETASAECDFVVTTLFINPIQFGANEDLTAYPRDEARDAALGDAAGTDVLFAPPVDEIYPPGFSTTVEVENVTNVLCGDPAHRGPSHFNGVATVVTKLFNIVAPDRAYFGQKDAQQAVIIRKLARDLNFPVEIVICPTIREADGLAMSSRNAYLRPEERDQALSLSRALEAAQRTVRDGDRNAEAVLAAARSELERAGVEPEYLELRSSADLSCVEQVNGSTLLAVAAQVGRARLIDNTILGDA